MQRTVLLIKPEQYKKMSSLAKKEHVSIAEINRRAIEQYLSFSQQELTALEFLAEQLEESNKRAEKALKRAEKNLDAFLKQEQEKK